MSCPDCIQCNTNYTYAEDDTQTTGNEQYSSAINRALLIDRHTHKFYQDQTSYNVEPTNQTLFLSLAYNIDQEIKNLHNKYSYNKRTSFKRSQPADVQILTGIPFTNSVPFQGFCLVEGAPQSVRDVNRWIEYQRKFHLPLRFNENSPLSTTIIFGGTNGNKIKVKSLGTAVIRILFSGKTFTDYRSLLIYNDNLNFLNFNLNRYMAW